MTFGRYLRHLMLGFFLIAAASSVLLFSDWSQRTTGGSRLPRIAVFQHASQAALDDGVSGIVDELAEKGFVDGKTALIQKFNAQNDLATANSIAKQLTAGDFDLIVTSSTLSMQTVANANKNRGVKHVFGIVADPLNAGVGINPQNGADHPAYMTGIGSLISAENALRIAKELYPGLSKIGLAWNAGESNSLTYTKATRAACEKLGLTLLEANVENSSAVAEAANSLVSRGADALFVTGDVTVLVAADSVAAAAKRGKIPAFSLLPPNVKKGMLFDLGANFYEVGRQVGELAAKVLNGTNPKDVPVTNLVPEKLTVNLTALTGLKDPWKLPEAMVAKAALVIDAAGVHDKSAPVQSSRNYKMGIVYFAPEEGADTALRGLADGLKAQGLEEGKNLQVLRSHAQGEIANIPALLQNYDSQDLDLIVTMTTPCLTGACSVVKKKNVVFHYVYDPIAAGAGKSREDHLPNITGVGSFPPVNDTVETIRKLVPGVKKVGTLYNSSEANSRKVISVAREAFAKAGIGLEEVTVTSSSEVLQAAQTLGSRGIQAMWVTGDNTALQGFTAIGKAARDAKLPLIINDPEFTGKGAVVAVGLGWYESGLAAGKLAARVLKGEKPASIPFEEVAVQQLVINDDAVARLGIRIPAEMAKQATHVKDTK
jgi:ABC-type uncharacterized transport system substrate-binding protein